MTKKTVYLFSEGNKDMRHLLGGKGANLAEMTHLGVNVPAGFIITTESCNDYYTNQKTLNNTLLQQIDSALAHLEQSMGKQLGSTSTPLLVSVRSGSVFSMPGMMDTILNLGLNDVTVTALAKRHHDERFAYDSYRRFIQMFSDVVMGIEKYKFEHILTRIKTVHGYQNDSDISADHLKEIVSAFKALYQEEMHTAFPQDTKTQLLLAVEAVFKSWHNQRAKIYRKLNHIDDTLGTAVTVQAMVFGNTGQNSGTGVCFSRNPITGEKTLFGEYLINAQGEDVVAGIRTPQPISTLADTLPNVYSELLAITDKLERHYKDMQDIEFTVENNQLYLLQTRNAKRTARANVEVAVSLVDENIITKEEAILRVTPEDINTLLHPTFDEQALSQETPLANGLPASPGAATGRIYFSAEETVKAAKRHAVILIREETSPEDIEGMVSAKAIVTARGGMTSHAAVVARGMGKCCVCGCQSLQIDYNNKIVRINGKQFNEGDVISVDGSTGKIYDGTIALAKSNEQKSLIQLLKWADDIKQLHIYVNADNAHDAKIGLNFGAKGIGLCRTEHMFFDEARINIVRKMILANSANERAPHLKQLEHFQQSDFEEMFAVLNGKSVTIRLLDPPLHEFLPHDEQQLKDIASDLNVDIAILTEKIQQLSEFNPMMGHRGCRLGVTYSDIYLMQARAISLAAIATKQKGIDVHVEIMIPLVSVENELAYLKDAIEALIQSEAEKAQTTFHYTIGTMIELPRACLIADQLAKHVAFFSFGTNDLTQMTYGFSRDDAGKFINSYKEKNILPHDPFIHLDESGVLELMDIAINKARAINPNIKIGICGEHGGDEQSILTARHIGLDYVSCSPYRVLIAKLAAAKAVITK